MPKRNDINSILIIGAGPIVIGQGCEFDYSGVQACKALKEEGYRIILINSNPATIMTDPSVSDATYIEPIHWKAIEKIIQQERPDALLPTVGGQTALNCAMDLIDEGILEKYNVELLGASVSAIKKAEDRESFRTAMRNIGLEVPRSAIAYSLEQARQLQSDFNFPIIIRPSFTLGGSGGGIARTEAEFEEICQSGFDISPVHKLLIEESLLGWKEFEMEVVRDVNDNCIIVCTIENLDPMGIHTGDSITVAPAQTLTDKEYQKMRNAAIAILREVGVETGGANVQFAVHPKTGRLLVIEMNPRVSRSSALASKATGYPIAKIAAKLAVGYTLDELANDITHGSMPASFEPTIDYVVTKIPRFDFEKFPTADKRLTTQMKSVGEVMALGRTFQESLQKALCGLETGLNGLVSQLDKLGLESQEILPTIQKALQTPNDKRLLWVADALRVGIDRELIYQWTGIDLWFITQIEELINIEKELLTLNIQSINSEYLFKLKRKGFSDARLAALLKVSEQEIRHLRHKLNIRPVYKKVDSCSGEFPSDTAYLYATYEKYCEASPSKRKKILILGGGPNRIGQGIEFDYCCVHAVLAVRAEGYEAIMVNCNPETVSTDYDIADRLYFEPLTLENVLEIIHLENPLGVIVQYGGQTPLKLVRALEAAGVTILGTQADVIDRAEDRKRFQKLIQELDLKQPVNTTAYTVEEGLSQAENLGYPIVVRPSYVLGGSGMRIVYNKNELQQYLSQAVKISEDYPILLDRYLVAAIELDVDAVSDGEQVLIAGILEHIEFAGVHSGDSSCCFPPFSVSESLQEAVRQQVKKLAIALGIVGPMNVQFAIQNDSIYILEVNPRVSRTMPFLSKAIGLPLAQIGVRCMLGKNLKAQGLLERYTPAYFCIKQPVFPFEKLPGCEKALGPEMKSTGEIMGIALTIEEAFAKCFQGLNKTFEYEFSKDIQSLQTLHTLVR